jgi:hypothetical protein
MSYFKNIIGGQYQIGEIVMGRGTNIIIETFDAKPYDVNQQDYQVIRADEVRFGIDSQKPTSIEITMDVLYSKLRPEHANAIPNFWHDMPTVADLAREWAFDEGRKIWGQMKPLYVCGRDDVPKIIYGRPGQFGATAVTDHSEVVPVVAEFRRADIYSYSVYENVVILDQHTISAVINGTNGDAPSWIRILIEGPITKPAINFQSLYQINQPYVVNLNYDVAAGETIEISSYPWERRAVSSTGENLSSYLNSATPYLDRLRIDPTDDTLMSITGGAATAQTQVIVLFRDAYRSF